MEDEGCSRILQLNMKEVDKIREIDGPSNFRQLPLGLKSRQALFEAASQTYSWLDKCRKFSERVGRPSDELSACLKAEFWELMTCGLTGEAYSAPLRFRRDFEKYAGFLEYAARASGMSSASTEVYEALEKHGAKYCEH